MEQLMEISRQVSALDWRLWRRPIQGTSGGLGLDPRYRATLGLAFALFALFLLCAQSMAVRQDLRDARTELYSLRADTDRTRLNAAGLLIEVSVLKSQKALSAKAQEMSLGVDVSVVDILAVTP